jgi:hypothetical protein
MEEAGVIAAVFSVVCVMIMGVGLAAKTLGARVGD